MHQGIPSDAAISPAADAIIALMLLGIMAACAVMVLWNTIALKRLERRGRERAGKERELSPTADAIIAMMLLGIMTACAVMVLWDTIALKRMERRERERAGKERE